MTLRMPGAKKAAGDLPAAVCASVERPSSRELVVNYYNIVTFKRELAIHILVTAVDPVCLIEDTIDIKVEITMCSDCSS